MIWLYLLIPVVLLVISGLCYDFFKRKSFKEVVNAEVNQNAELAKRNAKTWESGNFHGL